MDEMGTQANTILVKSSDLIILTRNYKLIPKAIKVTRVKNNTVVL